MGEIKVIHNKFAELRGLQNVLIKHRLNLKNVCVTHQKYQTVISGKELSPEW